MNTSGVSQTAEDYLTAIWKAYEWPESAPSTSELADVLGVTPSTVSANLKKLARDGLIEYQPYGPIVLTAEGSHVAVQQVRRHRIIETYLVEKLGLRWDQVHDEADRWEHAVSDQVLDIMDEILGHPSSDPHGDPIPPGVPVPDTMLLSAVRTGMRVEVVRVSDRHPEILRYLSEKSIGVGAVLDIIDDLQATGAVQIRVNHQACEVSAAAAQAVRVCAIS